MNAPMTIVFPLYAGVTQLDFTGPHQFLSRLPEKSIVLATVGGVNVRADGIVFCELADLEKVERCDVLCVPGGPGCTDALLDDRYLSSIRRLGKSASYVTSVCTGSLILGAAGLLVGKRATCHWAWRSLLLEFGAIVEEARIVRDGNVITGGGVTAGIDFSLALIAEIAGENVAQEIQLGLEYAPAPPFDSGLPQSAPEHILRKVQENNAPLREKRIRDVEMARRKMQTERSHS